VLLSQNRQAAKDHVRSDIEYEVNLKAELEIAQLHEKLDRLTGDVLPAWTRSIHCVSRGDRNHLAAENGSNRGGVSS